MTAMGVAISVLMPAYNEAENLAEVVPATARQLERLGRPYEIVVVDDGSTDGTVQTVRSLRDDNPAVRLLRLRRNQGKSAALSAGLARVGGEVIVLMDADGQDDPGQIHRLLDAVSGGLDMVTGKRAVRHDRIAKRWPSKLYNAATRRISGVEGSDFNSGFKAMRREVAESLDLYGELHRYIPVLAAWNGFSIGEVEVEHRPRLHGESKFGRARFWRGLLDLVTVKFLTTYTLRPFHLFGGIGAALGLVGSLLLGWLTVVKITGHAVGGRPALIAGVLLMVLAAQFLSLGLLAELLVHVNRAPSGVDLVRDEE
jgi:dolichol-phosphate mannosyltransferase